MDPDTIVTCDLKNLWEKKQTAYHSYADDTQIYLALSPNDYNPIDFSKLPENCSCKAPSEKAQSW